MKETISEEAKTLEQRIEKKRSEASSILPPSELVKLFTSRELDTVLSADETAMIASAIAGRAISTEYIKRLRLSKRLEAKKISERAYVYRLRDLLFVEFRKPYTRKPPGRPKKNEFSDTVKIAL